LIRAELFVEDYRASGGTFTVPPLDCFN